MANSLDSTEPVAWLSTDCIGERYLCFTKPKDSDPARPLVFGDTTPQPTQTQAGTVPLTGEQWQRITDLTGGRILTQAVKDEIERVIGIKGKEAGNAE